MLYLSDMKPSSRLLMHCTCTGFNFINKDICFTLYEYSLTFFLKPLTKILVLFTRRGAIITTFIVCYALTSFISGYVSGGLYSRNGGMILHVFFIQVLFHDYQCYFAPINRFLILKISCYLVPHLTQCTTS